jgi:hypothetical protein
VLTSLSLLSGTTIEGAAQLFMVLSGPVHAYDAAYPFRKSLLSAGLYSLDVVALAELGKSFRIRLVDEPGRI